MMGWWHGSGSGLCYSPGFNNGFSPAWGIAGALLTLLFWGVIIALAFLGIRAFVYSQRRAGQTHSGAYTGPVAPADGRALVALVALRERFARGEITKEQFGQMRRDLGV